MYGDLFASWLNKTVHWQEFNNGHEIKWRVNVHKNLINCVCFIHFELLHWMLSHYNWMMMVVKFSWWSSYFMMKIRKWWIAITFGWSFGSDSVQKNLSDKLHQVALSVQCPFLSSSRTFSISSLFLLLSGEHTKQTWYWTCKNILVGAKLWVRIFVISIHFNDETQ